MDQTAQVRNRFSLNKKKAARSAKQVLVTQYQQMFPTYSTRDIEFPL